MILVLSNPLRDPQTSDVIVVAGVTSPGVAEVSRAKRKHEWDVKKGKGAYGSTLTYVGRPPAQFSIKFKFATADQIDAWYLFMPLLKYDPTKALVTAVDISHPSLAPIDIFSVVTESVSNVYHEGKGLYSVECEFIEYFPPPPVTAVSTPLTSVPTNDDDIPGIKPPPSYVSAKSANDAALADLANLNAGLNKVGPLQ